MEKKNRNAPAWLVSAVLFSLAETAMPLVGLVIGYAASLFVSGVMHFVGPLLLIGVGLWELVEEIRERIEKEKRKGPISRPIQAPQAPAVEASAVGQQFRWGPQLLLALSISLDELAIGFSLGSVTVARDVSPFILCIFIGLQGFLMAVLGITLGRTLRTRLRPLREWSELLSGLLLIGLGIWLLVT